MLKMVRKGQMWWAIGPLAGGLTLSIISGYSPEQTLKILAVLSVSISLPLFVLYTYYFRYRNKKQIKTLSEKGNYNDILGPHEITISEDCLVEKGGESVNNVRWDSINRIETNADHTFVFTDEVSAYIIPHKGVTSGNISQFIDKLNSTFKKVAD